MSTFTITPAIRATLKRLFRISGGGLVLTEAGAIHNWETTFRFANPAAQDDGAAWITNLPENKRAILDAEELTVSGEGITVRQGLAVQSLEHLDVVEAPSPVAGPMLAAVSSLTEPTTRATFALLNSARSTDETLPILTGVALRRDGDQLVWSATDRYRLTIADTPAVGMPLEKEVILSGMLFAEITRRTAWSLDVHESAAVAHLPEFDGATVTIPHVDGEYPKVKSLIPEHLDPQGPRWEIQDPRAAAATLKALNPPRNTPAFMTASGEVCAQNTALVPFASAQGPEWEAAHLGFNAGFMREVLLGAAGPRGKDSTGLGVVVVHPQASPARPVIFSFSDAPRTRALLMPVRLPQGQEVPQKVAANA